MSVFFLIALVLQPSAMAASTKVSAYQFESTVSKKRQTYLVARQGDGIQLFSCGGLSGAAVPVSGWDGFVSGKCQALLGAAQGIEMFGVLRKGEVISLHLGGIESPDTSIMSVFGGAKSWLAVFSFNEKEDQALLLTGSGIEVGPTVPRMDSVRITLEKVGEGELSGSFPMVKIVSK